jgi:hypothetical protein
MCNTRWVNDYMLVHKLGYICLMSNLGTGHKERGVGTAKTGVGHTIFSSLKGVGYL